MWNWKIEKTDENSISKSCNTAAIVLGYHQIIDVVLGYHQIIDVEKYRQIVHIIFFYTLEEHRLLFDATNDKKIVDLASKGVQ